MLPFLKVVRTFTDKIFGIKEVKEVQITVLKTRAQLIAEGRGASIKRYTIQKDKIKLD
jgi:hypothetical protein